jgi:penicillin amidase
MRDGDVDHGADPPSMAARHFARSSISDWDRSLATNAPGQSGSPGSSHFGDLARAWADGGGYFPLAFSGRAVAANAETVLTLVPLVARRPAPAPSDPYFTR